MDTCARSFNVHVLASAKQTPMMNAMKERLPNLILNPSISKTP
jgi:hypothetical protein